MKLDKKIIDTWSIYVDKHFNVNNIHLKFILCHYLNYLQTEKLDIGKEVLLINNKLSNSDKYKKEIIKEYFNCLTGRKEFLLSDGSLVDPNNFVHYLDVDDLIYLFGLEFLSKFDIEETRDFKINEILKDEDRK